MDTAILDDLIPPQEIMFHGSRENFVETGNAFLWNMLAARCLLKPHHSVLDMGFGNGRHARALSRYLNAEGRYCGFDVVKASVDWCRQAYSDLPNFRFDHADLSSDWYSREATASAANYRFPYEDVSFDVAFAMSLFTHLDPAESQRYLDEAARVLKPGGRLLFTAFLVRPDAPQRDDIQGRRFERASDVHHVIDPERPSRGVGFDEGPMRAMTAAAGLTISEMYFGRWAQPTDVLANHQDAIIAVKA